MMKKTYVKPGLSLESFVLSQNIANNCGVPGGGTDLGSPTQGSKEVCGWEDPLGRVFWLDSTPCSTVVNEDFTNGAVCYNNPGGGFTIFGS